MPRIIVPSRLDDRLGQSALGHAVRLYVEQIERWVGDDTKGLFFFPEYTDHGPNHISSVLGAAEALIHEKSWPLVTPEDAAVLIVATLLHDSSMHLTADGLLNLLSVEQASRRPLIDKLDTRTWPQLFDDFFAEARRWDQRKLHKILGDQNKLMVEEEDLFDTIRRPSEITNPEQWTVRYRKFLGEFVRKHHARLAHEIVLEGVPGSAAGALKAPVDINWIADIAGLVARSHGLPLRGTFDYLEAKYYGRVKCRNVHAVFLMVVLRIADYLEIRPDRVNATLLGLQRLRSPLSQEEQDGHLDVEEVRPHEQDGEALFVIAKPRSASTFLKLQRLLHGLQAEIDTSWAVLGEVFSRDNVLRELGINLRRIRSNIDDPVEFFVRTYPSYFPIEAAFNTAGADLLKLLIKPLYGDRPEIGIRELLQNALDAVAELRQYRVDHAATCTPLIPENEILISIEKDPLGRSWLVVRDNGIGMTAETVRDYFLKAGASFRQSDAWRREFEQDGVSKVLRSGRFGIGALAAFLLGNYIEILSRHIEAKPAEGVQFSASLADAEIELLRAEKSSIGTDIRVLLTSENASRFENTSTPFRPTWDWYVFDTPKVKRVLYGREIRQRYSLPDPQNEITPNDWRKITTLDFPSIFWTYSSSPAVSCNGIIVRDQRPISIAPDKLLSPPNLSIVDPNGRLPLTLQRDDLISTNIASSAAILKDIIFDLYAFLLAYLPREPIKAEPIANLWPYFKRDMPASWLWTTPRGAILAHPEIIAKANITSALVVMTKENLIDPIPELFGVDAYLSIVQKGQRRLPDLLASSMRYSTKGNSFLVRRGHAGKKADSIAISEDWEIRTGGPDEDITTLVKLAECSSFYKIKDLVAVGHWKFVPRISGVDFVNTVNELTDDFFIPYDPGERVQKLSKAFEMLEPHLDAWRSTNLAGWRRELVKRLELVDLALG
jgi:molecular chaperone HtpG